MFKRTVLASIATVSVGFGVAQAQTGDQAKPQTMENVIVAASRSNTLLSEMPLFTTVITQEEIRKSPAQTLDQLLRQVPGINLTGAPYLRDRPDRKPDPDARDDELEGTGDARRHPGTRPVLHDGTVVQGAADLRRARRGPTRRQFEPLGQPCRGGSGQHRDAQAHRRAAARSPEATAR